MNANDTCKITSNAFPKHLFSIGVSLYAFININTKPVSSDDAFSIKFTIIGIYLWIGWGLVLISVLQSFTVPFGKALYLKRGTARNLEHGKGMHA